jgi:hypothetical protein
MRSIIQAPGCQPVGLSIRCGKSISPRMARDRPQGYNRLIASPRYLSALSQHCPAFRAVATQAPSLRPQEVRMYASIG